MDQIYHLEKFTLHRTGADGGHIYISSKIMYEGEMRKMVVFFESKLDERKINQTDDPIIIKGTLTDLGKAHSLNLLNAILID